MNNVLYQSNLSYDSLFYREITEHLVAGMSSLVEKGILPESYEESFRQGAQICQSFLVGAGFNVEEGAYSTAEIEESALLARFLDILIEKHGDKKLRNYPYGKIEDITRALHFFATGSAHRGSYPQEQLEVMYDFFWELREILNKECDESGIYIDPCSLLTQASHSLQ